MLLIKRLNSYWKHTWTQYSIVVVAAVKNSRISEFWKIKKKNYKVLMTMMMLMVVEMYKWMYWFMLQHQHQKHEMPLWRNNNKSSQQKKRKSGWLTGWLNVLLSVCLSVQPTIRLCIRPSVYTFFGILKQSGIWVLCCITLCPNIP